MAKILPEDRLVIQNGVLVAAYIDGEDTVVIPEGVTAIGDRAFNCCASLTEVIIPEGVTSIGDSAFYCCRALTNIIIPEGVTYLGNFAFSGCMSLTRVSLPASVTSIGNFAFYYCNTLAHVSLPEGVASIGINAFNCCDALETIVFRGSALRSVPKHISCGNGWKPSKARIIPDPRSKRSQKERRIDNGKSIAGG